MVNNIFDVIKNLTSVKNEEDLGTEIYSPYIINRFFSMAEQYIIYAKILNRYADIPKEYQEYFLFTAVPKKYVFLKYIKKDSINRTETIKEISEKLNLSDKKSIEVLEFLNKLNNIKNGME
jgi:hypothetical protein